MIGDLMCWDWIIQIDWLFIYCWWESISDWNGRLITNIEESSWPYRRLDILMESRGWSKKILWWFSDDLSAGNYWIRIDIGSRQILPGLSVFSDYFGILMPLVFFADSPETEGWVWRPWRMETSIGTVIKKSNGRSSRHVKLTKWANVNSNSFSVHTTLPPPLIPLLPPPLPPPFLLLLLLPPLPFFALIDCISFPRNIVSYQLVSFHIVTFFFPFP